MIRTESEFIQKPVRITNEWLTSLYELLAESEERSPHCEAEYASGASSEAESLEDIAMLSNNASDPITTVLIRNRTVTVCIGEPLKMWRRLKMPWHEMRLFSIAAIYDGDESRVYHLKPRLKALIERAVLLDGPSGESGKKYVEFGWGSAGEKRYTPRESRWTSVTKWIWTVLIGGALASLFFEVLKKLLWQ